MIYNEWMVVNMNWLASLGKMYVWVRKVAIFWYVLQKWLMVFLSGNILYRLTSPSPRFCQTLVFLDCEMVEVEKTYRIWKNSKWVRFYYWLCTLQDIYSCRHVMLLCSFGTWQLFWNKLSKIVFICWKLTFVRD